MCRRTEEEVVPTVGLPTPKTFRRFLYRARPTPTRGHPFYTVITTHRPIKSPFTTRWGYGGRILDLNPRRPHGGKQKKSPVELVAPPPDSGTRPRNLSEKSDIHRNMFAGEMRDRERGNKSEIAIDKEMETRRRAR